jgi:hypothetical protein
LVFLALFDVKCKHLLQNKQDPVERAPRNRPGDDPQQSFRTNIEQMQGLLSNTAIHNHFIVQQ